MVHQPRNSTLSRGVEVYGRSAQYHHKGLWAKKSKATPQKVDAEAKAVTKKVGGAKNGGSRVKDTRAKWYPTEDVPKPRANHKKPKSARLRESITPGTVLILLGGRFQGKRVVFLKQLESGLLLVTGPFKINGVPLRRVSQAYVIATSTKIDVSKVSIPETINDAFFKKAAAAKKKKSQEEFFAKETETKKELSAARIEAQKSVDSAIVAALKKDAMLAKYLAARFRLTKGQYPHEMTF